MENEGEGKRDLRTKFVNIHNVASGTQRRLKKRRNW